jgi:hypothetical protein
MAHPSGGCDTKFLASKAGWTVSSVHNRLGNRINSGIRKLPY